jgi:ribosomal protein S18 acetylase RimI-like enzyme
MQLLATPFSPSGQFTYLMSLYVEPPFRRRGIARHLVATMVEWSRAHGYRDIRLHASEQGRRLYESLGFRQTNEMRLLMPE